MRMSLGKTSMPGSSLDDSSLSHLKISAKLHRAATIMKNVGMVIIIVKSGFFNKWWSRRIGSSGQYDARE